MLHHFQVNGVLPITHDQVVAMIGNLEQNLLNAPETNIQTIQAATQSLIAPQTSAKSTIEGYAIIWSWGSRYSILFRKILFS